MAFNFKQYTANNPLLKEYIPDYELDNMTDAETADAEKDGRVNPSNEPMGPDKGTPTPTNEDIDIWQMAGDHLQNFRDQLASAHAMASDNTRTEQDPEKLKIARQWVSALNKIALRLDALEDAMAEANAKLGVLPTK